jgi:hypothetical protein
MNFSKTITLHDIVICITKTIGFLFMSSAMINIAYAGEKNVYNMTNIPVLVQVQGLDCTSRVGQSIRCNIDKANNPPTLVVKEQRLSYRHQLLGQITIRDPRTNAKLYSRQFVDSQGVPISTPLNQSPSLEINEENERIFITPES